MKRNPAIAPIILAMLPPLSPLPLSLSSLPPPSTPVFVHKYDHAYNIKYFNARIQWCILHSYIHS